MDILKKDIDIYYETWGNTENPKLVLQIFHGMSEHICRYKDFAEFLSSYGILVYGMNVRGHGQTGSNADSLGYFADEDGWNKVLKDQKDLHDLFRIKYPGSPFCLLGHSMGSYFARHYINKYPADFDSCIIMGTGKANDPAYGLARLVLKFLNKKSPSKLIHSLAFGGFNKGIKRPQTPLDWLSADENQVQRYIEDPFCNIPITNGFYSDFMNGMKEISGLETSPSVTAPCLFVSGESDPVGNLGKAVEEVYKNYVNATDAELKLFPNMRHEILNEKKNYTVYEFILKWIGSTHGINFLGCAPAALS